MHIAKRFICIYVKLLSHIFWPLHYIFIGLAQLKVKNILCTFLKGNKRISCMEITCLHKFKRTMYTICQLHFVSNSFPDTSLSYRIYWRKSYESRIETKLRYGFNIHQLSNAVSGFHNSVLILNMRKKGVLYYFRPVTAFG